MRKKLFVLTLTTSALSGCAKTYTEGEIKAEQKIIENREKYSKEIIEETNQCIKNANTLTNLTAGGIEIKDSLSNVIFILNNKIANLSDNANSDYIKGKLEAYKTVVLLLEDIK